MKRFTMSFLAVVLLASAAGPAFAHPHASPRVDRREFRQHVRIRDGVRSGRLTRREARRLHMGQRRIHRMEWRSKADGRFTMRERFRIHRLQDRQGRAIDRLRHNGRSI